MAGACLSMISLYDRVIYAQKITCNIFGKNLQGQWANESVATNTVKSGHSGHLFRVTWLGSQYTMHNIVHQIVALSGSEDRCHYRRISLYCWFLGTGVRCFVTHPHPVDWTHYTHVLLGQYTMRPERGLIVGVWMQKRRAWMNECEQRPRVFSATKLWPDVSFLQGVC